MKVGFVINGGAEHGIVRATILLAEALRSAGAVEVSILRSDAAGPTPAEFSAFQDRLGRGVVLAHASPHTNALWGPVTTRIDSLSAFLSRAELPTVIYLHDIYGGGLIQRLARKIKSSFDRSMPALPPPSALQPQEEHQPKPRLLDRIRSYEERFVRALDASAAHLIVSNAIEKRRLRPFVSPGKVSVLPHFIERRDLPADSATAKEMLGQPGRTIVTLLGFMVERKGHEDAIEALAHLPPDTLLMFAGKADDAYLTRLTALAEARGVADRLLVTGYLSEDDLNVALAATDVAICPFRDVSASGSLSTWLSAGRPIVAYDLPLMREYQTKFPRHLHLTRKGDAQALAANVGRVLALQPDFMPDLGQEYSLEHTAERLIAILHSLAGAL